MNGAVAGEGKQTAKNCISRLSGRLRFNPPLTASCLIQWRLAVTALRGRLGVNLSALWFSPNIGTTTPAAGLRRQ